MSRPVVQASRPHPGLSCRPAREMSRRALMGVLAIYAVLFAAGALRLWLAGS